VAARPGGPELKTFYRILVAIDAIVLAVLLVFFLWGLEDGTVSSFNMLLWLVMLAVPSGALTGGLLAWARGHRALALPLLLVPAAPGLLTGLFFLMLIILQPKW
jgi:hypothetical protein